MAVSVFTNIRIAGVAATVPAQRVINAQAHTFVTEEDRQKVISLTGVEEYRRADSSTCASDLCADAATRLIDGMNVNPEEIEAILFVSMTPDYRIPSTACLLQHRLNCNKATVAFDINMGCSGYLVGLYTICTMMQGAGLRKVLLLTGDTQTKLCYPQDKNVAFILADAGTATLLEYSDEAAPISIELNTDGGRFENLYIPSGGFRNPSNSQSREVSERPDGGLRADDHLFMNGMEIFKFSSTDVVDSLAGFMSAQNTGAPDYDNLFLHQANKFMLDKIATKLGFPSDNVPYSIQKYGNTGSASIPMTIAHHATSTSNGTDGRSLLCGFGVGLSWGIADVSLDGVYVPSVGEYSGEQSKTPTSRKGEFVVVFPGQGSQAVGMGQALFEASSATRELFQTASELLDTDFEDLIMRGPESELVKTSNVQPAVTLVNIAVLHAFRDHGIDFVAAGGHSLGEYAALYAAGVLSLRDTLTIVKERGRLMQAASDAAPGGMTAVMGLSDEQLLAICADDAVGGNVQIANLNSDSQTILTGTKEALGTAGELAEKMGATGVVELRVSGAWHSKLMQPASDAMHAALETIEINPASVPVVCNVTGKMYESSAEIKRRLVEQVVAPVNWISCVRELIHFAPGATLLEAGPGSSLTGLSRDIDKSVKAISFDQIGGDVGLLRS